MTTTTPTPLDTGAHLKALMKSGVAHQRAKRPEEARAAFDAVLAADPKHGDALHFLGLLASEAGDIGAAAALMDRGLALAPLSAMQWANRATLFVAQGIDSAAEACFRRAIALKPSAAAWLNLGLLCDRQERVDEAISAMEAAIALDDTLAKAHQVLGRLHRVAKRYTQAEPLLRRAVALAPDVAEMYADLTHYLVDIRQLEEAEAIAQRAIDLDPTNPSMKNLMAIVLGAAYRYVEAERLLRDVLAENPLLVEMRHNLSMALSDQLRHEEAEALVKEVLADRPGHANALMQLGMMHLQQGRYATGWEGYEHRKGDRRILPFPEWQGEDIAGKRIVLFGEQGFGDHLQFARFITLMRDRGATVDLVCHPVVQEILRTVPGVNLVTETVLDFPYDYWARLMGVAGCLDITEAHLPGPAMPYLTSDPLREGYWEARINGLARQRPRVGLVWGGNPDHSRDFARSLPLTLLAPLAEAREDIVFFSLQKGPPAAQLSLLPTGFSPIDLGPELLDYSDTAAALKAIDLVITVDSSVSHLAGALHRPVWVMLMRQPDWRWLLDREDSPWYPRTRLFRQTGAGEWGDVVLAIKKALTTHSFSERA